MHQKQKNNITYLLTDITLAIWIQDDGHSRRRATFINTQSYFTKELEYLISAFDKNFGIKAEMRPVSDAKHLVSFVCLFQLNSILETNTRIN